MTKAERIFYDTRRACKNYIEDCGYKEGVGFNRLTYGDHETVPTRTANNLQKILRNKKKGLSMDLELGVITKEAAEKEAKVLLMVEATLKNHL